MNRTPLRGDDVRIRNEKLVLNIIFRIGTAAQSQVVQETGLKAPTVFRIFAKLEEEGYIRQCPAEGGEEPNGETMERKGRRPSFYCVNPDAHYAVGVDFSSLAASVIAVDFANSVIHQATEAFPPGVHRDQVLETIEALIRGATGAVSLPPERMMGIGIASPGVVNTVTGRVVEYARIGGLAGYAMKEHFEDRFAVPVYVHNNASVIAASAYHYGAARNEKSLLAILVRSGVGGALVNHGRLFINGTDTALEIGRTTLGPAAPTLESVVAEQPMLAVLSETFGVRSWEEVQGRLFCDEVSRVLADACRMLATAVTNLNHIFHPEAVLLISRFPIIAEVLGSAARAALPGVRVISSVYDPVEACYGATDLVFQHFFGLTDPAA